MEIRTMKFVQTEGSTVCFRTDGEVEMPNSSCIFSGKTQGTVCSTWERFKTYRWGVGHFVLSGDRDIHHSSLGTECRGHSRRWWSHTTETAFPGNSFRTAERFSSLWHTACNADEIRPVEWIRSNTRSRFRARTVSWYSPVHHRTGTWQGMAKDRRTDYLGLLVGVIIKLGAVNHGLDRAEHCGFI
jgi:hypothetical protein